MLHCACGSARLKEFNPGLSEIEDHSGTTARVRLLLQHYEQSPRLVDSPAETKPGDQRDLDGIPRVQAG
jgi:hypothetical protein